MSLKSNTAQIKKLELKIQNLLDVKPRSKTEDRQLNDSYRAILRICQDMFDGKLINESHLTNNKKKHLTSLARDAILHLGGESDPRSLSLKDYNHNKYGPYLGISDEGSAANIIREAALKSPKVKAIGDTTPLIVGLAHDAERLGAIGEVPVGPDEYANIRAECIGRILTSTNVGTRLNLRHYKRYPVVTVLGGPRKKALSTAKDELKQKFEPFFNTPDKNPRPLAVYIEFYRKSRRSFDDRVAILRELVEFASNCGTIDQAVHRFGFQMRIGFGAKGCRAALLAINLASAAGFTEVAIDGVVSKEADEKVSLPGLLNYLKSKYVDQILDRARVKGIKVYSKNIVDPDTVARNVWGTLNSARQMGLELGKYGTFPLTLEECHEVTKRVQHWFSNWTAAPVFFVDQGAISYDKTYIDGNVIAGIKEWLKIISQNNVPVVLIDTLDKSKGWRLFRSKGIPKGLLKSDEIKEIDQIASKLGVKVLWAGGISLAQAFEFGKMGVFGIYITSAVTSKGPVLGEYERDPLLASLKEPSIEGVFRAKLLLEAGFIASRLHDFSQAKDIEGKAKKLIKALDLNKDVNQLEKVLFNTLVDAWETYLNQKLSKSLYLSGIQCLKNLYLNVFQPADMPDTTVLQQDIFKQGIEVGKIATQRYTDGIRIEQMDHHEAIMDTRKATKDPNVNAIFEAAFEYNGVKIRVDILERKASDQWNLIEVKSSTGTEDINIQDVALQIYVLEGTGLSLADAGILYLNKNYTLGASGLDPQSLFKYSSYLAEAHNLRDKVKKNIDTFRKVIKSENEPVIHPGLHCRKPYDCQFQAICIEPPGSYSISNLPGGTRLLEQLAPMGITDVRNIPSDVNLNTLQKRACRAMIQNKEYVGPQLRRLLEDVAYPIHFIDFETLPAVIPRFTGTRVYQHIPFQWSNHIMGSDGRVVHKEFLHCDDSNPRVPFIEKLLETVRDVGTIFVYHNFEKLRLRELAKDFPIYKQKIDTVINRLTDLLVIIKNNYYHPQFGGSFSIKAVLPTVTDLSYDDLVIRSGAEAYIAYQRMINLDKTDNDRKKIKDDLLRYCRRDSEAMLEVRKQLLERC